MNMAAEERVTVYCRCDGRMAAHARCEFLWSYTRDCWYFPDLTRQQTEQSKYYHGNHDGEPYGYHECPWCGNTLPGCGGDTQADGNKEVE